MNQRLLFLAVAVAVALLPAPVLGQGAPARDNINALIEEQAKANGVPASFVHQVVKRESNYNPHAKGGSALGLMQIKHATARGLGYTGDAAGLYDPKTNLRYGIAYLAGAYRTAKGNISQAYTYYNKGYYYAAKRQGVGTQVAGLDDALAPPQTGAAFSSVFAKGFGGLGLRSGSQETDPNLAAAGTALAYAPSLAVAGAPTELVEVPLPPRRPASLSGTAVLVATASLAPASAASLAALSVGPEVAPASAPAGSAVAEAAISESVEVPLPPRRPSALALAAFGRPIVAKKAPAAGTVLEASALATAQ